MAGDGLFTHNICANTFISDTKSFFCHWQKHHKLDLQEIVCQHKLWRQIANTRKKECKHVARQRSRSLVPFFRAILIFLALGASRETRRRQTEMAKGWGSHIGHPQLLWFSCTIRSYCTRRVSGRLISWLLEINPSKLTTHTPPSDDMSPCHVLHLRMWTSYMCNFVRQEGKLRGERRPWNAAAFAIAAAAFAPVSKLNPFVRRPRPPFAIRALSLHFRQSTVVSDEGMSANYICTRMACK